MKPLVIDFMDGHSHVNAQQMHSVCKPVGLSLHMNCLHQMVEKLDPSGGGLLDSRPLVI